MVELRPTTLDVIRNAELLYGITAEDLRRELERLAPTNKKVTLDAGPEVRTVNAATGGEKGQKQVRLDLIPTFALWQVGKLYGIGAAKYAENNWRQGYEWSKSYAALQRHANLFWSGESFDSEGFHHLAAVVFHALALMTFEVEHPELDDRFIPGKDKTHA